MNAKLAISDGTFLPGPTQYRLVVGSLVYLTITRLDIAFAVHAVNRFVTTPNPIHWQPLCVPFVIFITQQQNAILSSSNSLTFIAYSNSDRPATFMKNPLQDIVYSLDSVSSVAPTTFEIVWL